MPSLHPGFEYDIFISYRQNDNRSGWVRQFVEDLHAELSATIKEPIHIYFDENPHDGLLDTHLVDESLARKLRCMIFMPILSHTYCDLKSFAWNNELLAFCSMAADQDNFHVTLSNGNVTSRVLPVQIHELGARDQQLFEMETKSPLRSIEFIFRTQGVNRPLTASDARGDNLNKTVYRDQVNKTANAIQGIIEGITGKAAVIPEPALIVPSRGSNWFWTELGRRNVIRAGVTYLIMASLIYLALKMLAGRLSLDSEKLHLILLVLLGGFPVALFLAWLFEVSPQGFIRTNSLQSLANPYPPHRKKPLTGAFSIFVLLLATVVIVIISELASPQDEPERITIGVITFENRSEIPGDKYLAVTLTDDIINRLIVVSRFRVTAEPKVVGSKEMATAGILEVARNMEVAYILTGSIQRSGKDFIVRSQLFEAKSSTFAWANTFTLTPRELVDAQSSIVLAIVNKLGVELNESEQLRLRTPVTDNPTAYDYYMRGRSLYLKYNLKANDSAAHNFRMAIARDPSYAKAWAGLGDAYSLIHRFRQEEAWRDSSMAAATKAIQLDSNLSEAYNSLGNAYNAKRLYDKAYPLFVKSVELNPMDGRAVGNLGTNFFHRGNLPEALRLQKESAKLNPKGFIPYYIAGWIYARLGDFEKAEQWLIESLDIDSTFSHTYEILAYAYIGHGKKEKALELATRVVRVGPNSHRNLERAGLISHYCGQIDQAKYYYQQSIDNNTNFATDPGTISPIGLGAILLQEGNRVKAEVLLQHVVELNMKEVSRGSLDDDTRYNIAAANAVMGKKAEAIDWLQKAFDLNWLDYTQLASSPFFENVRNEPEFVSMLKSMRSRLDAMRKTADKY